MVEELLVTLPDFQRESGWNLLAELDERGMQITAAFWLYKPERERWELYLVTPLVGQQGGIKTYLDTRAALDTMTEEQRGALQLSDTVAVEPEYPLVREMRRKYGQVTAKRGQQVRRSSVVSGEPFIYRLQ